MILRDPTFARENVKQHRWAQEIVEDWRENVAYAMQQDRAFFEGMIAELTSWPEYGQNCPGCVNRLSSMGECGIYEWDIRDPDRLTCMYCKTVYPNSDYPETGSVTAPKMGQTFTFYLTEEERAHPEDRSGEHAFKWVRWPVHTSWTGIIRSKKNGWCLSQMGTLANLYAVTGDRAYAERAAWILDILSARYPNYLFHSYDGTVADLPPSDVARSMGEHPPAGRFPIEAITTAFDGHHQKDGYAVLNNGFWGAGRFGCSGSDGGFGRQCALVYDAIREARTSAGDPVLSPEALQRVEQDLILSACADSEHWDAVNNKCGPGRALSAAVGILFGRPESVRRAIEGFDSLLEEGYHFDGFCTESPSYSNMHLNLLREIPEFLSGYSDPEGYTPESGDPIQDLRPFEQFPRYRLALLSMIRMLDPNLEDPVIGDSRYGRRIQSIYAEVLAAHYGDQYAGLLEHAQDAPLGEKGSEYALWHRRPDLKVDGDMALPLRSEWFPGWQVAVMRGGTASSHTAFYHHAAPFGVHRHYDTLGLIYLAHGREMATDRGYIWDDPRNAWTKSTRAHNIVTVDGENQMGNTDPSTLELFGAGAGVEVVQSSAKTYEQCDLYRRTNVLVQIPGDRTYAVDLFRVHGGSRHQYNFHCNRSLISTGSLTLTDSDEEMAWLEGIREGRPDGPVTATWQDEDVRLDMRLLSPVDRVLVADAPGWRTDSGEELNAPPVQQILAERNGDAGLESTYASILSPYQGDQSPVKGAELLVHDEETGAVCVMVEREGVKDYVISAPQGGARDYGPVWLAGRFGFVSVSDDGHLQRAYLLDGTELIYQDVMLTLSSGSTLLDVSEVSDRTFHLSEPVPEGAAPVGSCVLAGPTGYEVESAGERSITVRDYPAIACDQVTLLHAGEWVGK
jgi:hypothetical protein